MENDKQRGEIPLTIVTSEPALFDVRSDVPIKAKGDGMLKHGDGEKSIDTVSELRAKEEAPRPALISPDAISSEDRKREKLQTYATCTEPKTSVSAKPPHQRSVLWGDTKIVVDTAAPNPITTNLSPELSPRSPSGDNVFSLLTPTDYASSPRTRFSVTKRNSGSTSSRRGIGGIDLDDILKLNPLESEAETLIMMAIEKQETMDRAWTGTGNSMMLGSIPDESAHVFLPQLEEPEGSPCSNAARPTPVKSHVTPVTTNRSRSSMMHQQRPPLPVHRRIVTMVDILASQTAALAGYQGASTNPLGADESRKATPSAGETLAKNASFIYRGRPKTEGKPEHVTEDVSTQSGPAKLVKGSLNRSKFRNSVVTTNSVDTSGNEATFSVAQNENGLPNLLVSRSVEAHKKTDCANNNGTHEIQNDIECDATSQIYEDIEGGKSGGNEIGTTMGIGRKSAQKGVWKDFQVFTRQRRPSFVVYLRFLLLVFIPALVVAFILFHFAGNPPTGRADLAGSGNGVYVQANGDVINPMQASTSWWIIFICIRQTLTFSLAQLLQVFIIDFLCLNTRFFVNVFGHLVTLLIVQSKGWPFIALIWAVLDFILLYGTTRFASHWLYWQDISGVMNEENPGGSVTSSAWNQKILIVAICLGAVVSMKRLWLGLYLGKKTFVNYAEELTKLVDKVITLCQVAALAREIKADPDYPGSVRPATSVSQFGISRADYDGMFQYSDNDDDEIGSRKNTTKSVPTMSSYQEGFIIDPTCSDPCRGSLDPSQKSTIDELLGDWEEPEAAAAVEENVSISGILQFRNSLALLENSYMFSIAWGDVSTRDRMIISSQEVFGKLMQNSSDPALLKFDVLARIAELPDGTLDQEKLKRLIRLLRPDRDGNLALLEFVKSVDSVYKEAKLLRASVKNSEKIDRAYGKAINGFFYIIVVCVILGQLGLNLMALYVGLSSLILGFAFMIGSASSKIFEGWLFILVRRPYNIGDRIHISNVDSDTSPNGSMGWIVSDVTLFHTTAVFATTGEKATMSNGSLASSRVINMARSPKATVYIYLKFAMSVPYERIQIFEQALRDFVKARPREWANLSGFRATQVLADLNYIEYVVVLVHREAWQNIGSILNSKAQVSSFCLELSKKLDMRYQSPALPVDIAFVNRGGNAVDSQTLAAKLAGFANDDSSGCNELMAMYDKTK